MRASASPSTSNEAAPFSTLVFVACANDGAGETVSLSGMLHSLSHTTISASGNVVTKYHFQPQGLSGVVMTTGALYQGTGVTQGTQTFQASGLPAEFTDINNFRIIGQGNGDNYLVHSTFHITFDADGTMTAYVDHSSVECK